MSNAKSFTLSAEARAKIIALIKKPEEKPEEKSEEKVEEEMEEEEVESFVCSECCGYYHATRAIYNERPCCEKCWDKLE